MKSAKFLLIIINILFLMSCNQNPTSKENTDLITIMTVAPGHFHAALIQKYMYPQVDSKFFVYAPEGPEVQDYLSRIDAYNSRSENPTRWKENLYLGDDFFQKMLDQKPGNLVTLAGNNKDKTEYIYECINNGLHVLSDKPMAIEPGDFNLLKETYILAKKKNVLLYDIMTERFEVTTILQRAFSQQEEIFGKLQIGSIEEPAISKESVHHFLKIISGIPLKRPPWVFDIEQEGEAIADVGTHLVDLIQWEAFPGEMIDYKKDIEILDSKRWTTDLTKEQFKTATGLENYPSYLQQYVDNEILKTIANSSVNYTLKGVHAKVSVEWKLKAPEGAGDTHYSIMRGTISDLIIKQGKEEGYKPTLYIKSADEKNLEILEKNMDLFINNDLNEEYPELTIDKIETGYWRLNIPGKYHVGHEAHFAQVTRQFLKYMEAGEIPEIEIVNMLAKYYTTTKAVEMAK